MATREIPFRPNLEGEFRARFYNAVSSINRETSVTEIDNLCSTEINWVENECVVNIVQRRKYRAVWYLFRDLIRASWKAEFKEGILYMRLSEIASDDDSSTKEAKDLIRSWMSESRHERIVAASDFVSRIENSTTSKKPVTDLIADGAELAKRLEMVSEGSVPVTEVVKPYLQLVTDSGPNSIDVFTNQRIADIWRYFRMTWATPAENTPGRTMQYLIRDAAHPMHAVMGLASLENCAVAISCRDEFIGWTQSAMNASIKSGQLSPLEAYQKLISYLNEGIDSIDYSDLCEATDIQNPSSSVIEKLNSIAVEADNQRKNMIVGNNDDLLEENPEVEGDIARSEQSVQLLFRHKRAEQLAKNLASLIVLRQVITRPNFTSEWEEIGDEEAVGTAIRVALTVQKSKHIGTSMLELNVCGAVPPYNEILGGKLVALLATSPQVIHDYKERYGGRRSEIASKLKGSDICRPADLVYIGTTSLYSIGSSQYNRLKIPHEAIDAKMDIKWEKLGYTTGYGTLHISKATTLCLKETMGDNNKINHVFGEGPSPKMRLLAASIRDLLESAHDDTKEFTKHAMSRIVYGAKIACNTSMYMLGFDESPDYYTDIDNYSEGTEKIIKFWQERWLAHRIKYLPIFDRLKAFDKNSIIVSNEIRRGEEWHYEKLSDHPDVSVVTSESGRLQFIRDFYRGKSAFADGVHADDLKSIHVKTKLDDAICEAVSHGNDVVLTGNPGDGKTHIIRMLESDLLSSSSKIEIELDASTKSNEELFSLWKTTRENGKAFVIAINAAVLHSLYLAHKDFKPIADAYNQMIHAVNHGEDLIDESDVVVFDLSKREILTEEIIGAVIAKLTAPEHYTECVSCPLRTSCPVAKNRQLLNTTTFQNRILAISKRAILKGYHTTLRDLQAFVSYLIFGNRDCSTIAKTSGNNNYDIANLVYSGKGKLFDAFKEAFDPVTMSHPVWDEKILTNSIEPSSWIPEFDVPVEAIDAYNQAEFALRKRQFFFFNTSGMALLDILDDDIAQFQNFMSLSDKSIARDIVGKLNAFFGKPELSKELEIWSGHRFNNSPRKVLISSGSIKTNKFIVGHPKLLPTMSNGIDMSENYLRIMPKENLGVFLKIDFAMYSFLAAAEHGVPVLYMDSVMTKRVWRFIEQLQAMVESDDDVIDLSLFDIQNKTEYLVEISVDERKYTSITKKTQK